MTGNGQIALSHEKFVSWQLLNVGFDFCQDDLVLSFSNLYPTEDVSLKVRGWKSIFLTAHFLPTYLIKHLRPAQY